MPTANEQISDSITTHSVNLLRVESSLRQAVLTELKRLEGSLVSQIAKLPASTTTFKRARLNKLLAQARGSIIDAYEKIAVGQGKQLSQIASTTQSATNKSVNNALGVDVMTTAQSATQLESMVRGQLLNGQHQREWWAKQSVDLRGKFERAMRDGMHRGEGMEALVRRVMGSKAKNFTDGIMQTARHHATALVRTGVQSVANEARINAFLANLDVIKGIQWRSTLDSRTTVICMGLDGKQWSLPDFKPIGHELLFPGPTAHWSCRSTQTAITRSWSELAGKKIEPPKRDPIEYKKALEKKLKAKGMSDAQITAALKEQRIGLDGKAVNPESFTDFLKRQGADYQDRALGPQRAQLWREGKITLTDLIDQQHRPLSVDELHELVQKNEAVPPVPSAKEGQNGLGLLERGLLEESLLYGQQKQSVMTHFVDVATGERHSFTGISPGAQDLSRAATFTRLAVLRNGLGPDAIFSPQELGLFGKLTNFQQARLVQPNGRVVGLQVKRGRVFDAASARELNQHALALKNTFSDPVKRLSAASRASGGNVITRTTPAQTIKPPARKADGSLLTSSKPVVLKRAWIDHAPSLPFDTLQHWTDANGKVKPERLTLHEQIVRDALNRATPVPAGQQPIAVLMMGGSASGKTTFSQAYFEQANLSNFVSVDADAIKEALPEYRFGVQSSARDTAQIVHEESSKLAKQVRDGAIDQHKNIFFDGTGANADGYAKLIAWLKEEGYHVKIIAVNRPVEDAVKSSMLRAEKKGRWVPESFIRDVYQKVPVSFARNYQLADEFELWDNGGNQPSLAWERAAGEEHVYDEEYASQFGWR